MHLRTRVKFCGITRIEDAINAVDAGADALGFVFFAGSARYVSPERAAAIVARLPPFVTTVGLFVDADPQAIEAVLRTVRIDVVQFHGSETPAVCETVERPFIKAIRMTEGVDLAQQAERYANAAALLVDTFDEQFVGGTGQVFDWSIIPSELPKPLVLAGGLNVANVAEAIDRVRPFAVDVSSGIEAQKGIKDVNKMKSFIRGVRASDA